MQNDSTCLPINEAKNDNALSMGKGFDIRKVVQSEQFKHGKSVHDARSDSQSVFATDSIKNRGGSCGFMSGSNE